jgi:hypothetical protein
MLTCLFQCTRLVSHAQTGVPLRGRETLSAFSATIPTCYCRAVSLRSKRGFLRQSSRRIQAKVGKVNQDCLQLCLIRHGRPVDLEVLITRKGATSTSAIVEIVVQGPLAGHLLVKNGVLLFIARI